jgi:hypothetical protein
VLSILNTKKGASDHMKLIVKSGQLSNVVIFKAPRQIGGEIGGRNTHATDPGKAAGSHFIEKKNRDSIPTVDRCRKAGKASLGKPKSGSVQANIENLYIRSYGQTASVTSNLRVYS